MIDCHTRIATWRSCSRHAVNIQSSQSTTTTDDWHCLYSRRSWQCSANDVLRTLGQDYVFCSSLNRRRWMRWRNCQLVTLSALNSPCLAYIVRLKERDVPPPSPFTCLAIAPLHLLISSCKPHPLSPRRLILQTSLPSTLQSPHCRLEHMTLLSTLMLQVYSTSCLPSGSFHMN